MSGLTFGACCSADIQRQLLPHETWTDRPDVVNAVFRHKLKVFLLLLEGGKPGSFFPGKQVFIFRVIEWQKRGLPHCEFPSPRPRSPTVSHFPPFVVLPDAGHIAARILVTGAFNHFDHVSACIPMVSPYSDPEDQRLHYLVQKHNIHANNGSVCTLGVTTKSPCRNPLHHRCSKFFPKPLSRTNHFDDRVHGRRAILETTPTAWSADHRGVLRAKCCF